MEYRSENVTEYVKQYVRRYVKHVVSFLNNNWRDIYIVFCLKRQVSLRQEFGKIF